MKADNKLISLDLVRMITPEARLSFPHFFKPQAPKGSDNLKYSGVFLFPKFLDEEKKIKNKIIGLAPDKKTARTLGFIIKQAKIKKYGEDESEWPDDILSALKDGDDPEVNGDGNRQGYEGHWVLTAKCRADQRPTVVNMDMSIIEDPSVVYPGCYVRAFIQAYCFEHTGKRHLLFGLDHVQKIRDGQSFGGRKSVEQVFSPIVDDTDQAPEESFL